MAKTDIQAPALNVLAARLDALEVAVGSTVSQAIIDELKAVSECLKDVGAVTEAAAVPVAPVTKTSSYPKSKD